ncbi:MAG TPA: hypothetical protein VFP55_02745 [Solirubrobacteraceae bacterium]|nr:hypothetical protein [Solirubrobacteraceae bacterium]
MAAALIPFGLVVALTFANTPDDPLITLRYAWNLIHHGQPVFNLGERVEGFTSPLHLLLAALLLLLPGGYALFKLKLASVALAGLALGQTARLARLARLPRWGQLAAVVAVGGSWNFAVSASNGLETSLCVLLVTGATASLLDPRQRTSWQPAVWTGILALARPDALLVIASLACVSLKLTRDSRNWREIRWCIGPVLTTAALVGFRALYYHSLLPNTYYAKHLPLGAALVWGAAYLLGAQPLSGPGAAILLSLQLWLAVIAVRGLRGTGRIGFPGAVLVAQLMFILGSGGDWMKGGRFLAPALPALAVLMMMGVEVLCETVSPRRRRRRSLIVLLGAAAVALLALPMPIDYNPAWALSRGVGDQALIADGGYGLSGPWIDSAALASCLAPGQTVADSEVGLFGWEHLDLRVLDMRGLTSSAIARNAPPRDKALAGVVDPRWYLPGSPVGRVLERARPAMIIGLHRRGRVLPSAILDGRYARRSADLPTSVANRITVYLRRGVRCSAPVS